MLVFKKLILTHCLFEILVSSNDMMNIKIGLVNILLLNITCLFYVYNMLKINFFEMVISIDRLFYNFFRVD